MKKFGIKNVVVTPNGVNTACFFPGAQQNLHELPDRYILYIGSLQPRKNLQSLLEAWKEIKDEYKNYGLSSAGTGCSIWSNKYHSQ